MLLPHQRRLRRSRRPRPPEVRCGVDESHVREGLREVAERISRLGIDFLRVQAKIVLVCEQLAKREMSFLQSPSAQRQVFSTPEAAYPKNAFWGIEAMTIQEGIACT